MNQAQRLIARRRPAAFAPSYANAALDRLARLAGSDDGWRRETADLSAQPGRYACSTPEIDFIVDLAGTVPGVIGAQIAGAGLGGCAMILVRTEALEELMAALKRGYYRPRKLQSELHVCQPVGGSGILSV